MEKPNFTYNSDMEYLLNPLIKHTQTNKELSKKDIKFYRKRIIQLTRNLLYKKDSDILDNILLKHFNDFTFLCIEYFKNMDANDLLQKEFADINLNLEEEFSDTSQDDINYDNQIIKKNTKKITMDQFINKTPKSKPIILPIKKTINLDDPKLKMKDCKEKS